MNKHPFAKIFTGFFIIFLFVKISSSYAQTWEGTGDIYYNDGKVGIGVSDPEELLEVKGNILMKGNYYKLIQSRSNVYLEHLISGNGQGGGLMFNASYSGSGNPQGNATFQINAGTYNTTSGYLDFDGNARRWGFYISNPSAGIGQPVTYKELAFWDSNNGIAMSPSGNGKDFFMDTNGNVGIGTDSPTNGKLHVVSTSTLGNWGSINTSNATLRLQDSGSNMYLDGNTIYADALMNIGTIGNHNLTLGTNNTSRITILNNGKVGIGTSPTNSQLHIYRNETTGGWGSMTTSKSGLRVQDSGANLYMDGNSVVTNGNMLIGTTEGRYVSFGTNGTERIRLFANGNVSIGTSTDYGYKLAVDGKAIMEEVKVEMSSAWPDYVFTPSYNLQSLKEVETFINKNGHLPNIPSAAEVEEDNGIELGEMNAKLLEKIEELTLYMIELKKENQSLKTRIEKIESSVEK